ncbi:HEAT repeat domain-containing protein [Streptomyces caniscabiei]|uniref:HEAT repeat domain-containing protein n=1 Tax=Streptomyces caniscabiei TaxID=2746961 RepID=A0A927L1Y3_9ACTN|nr:HEAT repeat domain-containing protein [Streptomyces caniscabiei]MBD9724486.1 HEAT repeat domain-containing protein [Streptomyces caniscabiei]MDX3507897.1 HEAT repeat domain-containing protein [Streptomyces caniscabiei]MDX3717859.1 HEAT repeat domain-containing protein [Streptomyces caniscabiei]WEO25590.1 HEAT repeat domain-containing protein [Streptomyces caniscabiei]
MRGLRGVRGGGASGAAHQIAHFLRESRAGEPGRRAAAVKGLGRVGLWASAEHGDIVAGVGPAVLGAAGDAEALVRAAVADALGWLGPPGGDDAGGVVVALMGDADPRVRRRASLAAERLELTGPEVTEAFRRLLDDADRHLRLNGLLGVRGRDGDIEPALLVRLLGDSWSLVWGHARLAAYALLDRQPVLDEMRRTARQGHGLARARALEMLPERHTRDLRDSLLDGLRDECPEVRQVSAGLLARDLGGPAEALLSSLGLSGAVDSFFSALRRSGAAEPLLPLLPSPRPSATADALLAALKAETDADVAARLLGVLGRWGDVRAVPSAVRWLDHPDAGGSAVHALAGIGTPAAVRWIRAVFVSAPGPDLGPGLGQPSVRAAAATAYGRLAPPDAVESLLPLLREPDRRVRIGAVDGLGQLGRRGLPDRERQAAAEALLDLLTTDEPALWHTGNALARYPETLPAVRRLIDHPSGEVRATVLRLLDEDDDADVALFLVHLHDPHESARHQALWGIDRYVDAYGELPEGGGHPAATEDPLTVITALAQPPSPQHIRYAANRVLGRLT